MQQKIDMHTQDQPTSLLEHDNKTMTAMADPNPNAPWCNPNQLHIHCYIGSPVQTG